MDVSKVVRKLQGVSFSKGQVWLVENHLNFAKMLLQCELSSRIIFFFLRSNNYNNYN